MIFFFSFFLDWRKEMKYFYMPQSTLLNLLDAYDPYNHTYTKKKNVLNKLFFYVIRETSSYTYSRERLRIVITIKAAKIVLRNENIFIFGWIKTDEMFGCGGVTLFLLAWEMNRLVNLIVTSCGDRNIGSDFFAIQLRRRLVNFRDKKKFLLNVQL